MVQNIILPGLSPETFVRDYYTDIQAHIMSGSHSFSSSGKLTSELILLCSYL